MEINDCNMIIHVDKEIDHCVAEKIKMQFEDYYTRGRVKNVIFDMAQVEFMDSSGIGMIMGRYSELKRINGRVVVAAVPESIDKLLVMSGVYRFIYKCDSVIQAINILNKKAGRLNA